jgi:hypothetical protein
MKTYFILLALCFTSLLYGQNGYETMSVYSTSIQGISFPLKKKMTLREAADKNKLVITQDHMMETREVFMCFKDSVGYSLVTTYGPNGVVNSEEVLYFKVLLVNTKLMPNEMIVVIGWKEQGENMNALCVMDYYEEPDLYQFIFITPDKKTKRWAGVSFMNADIEFNVDHDIMSDKTQM